MLPTVVDCLNLWKKYYTPENVIMHIKQVTCVCQWLIMKSQERKIELDGKLVVVGAMLHDFMRYVGMKQGYNLKLAVSPPSYEEIAFWQTMNEKYHDMHHDEAAAAELQELGYDGRLVRIVFCHQKLVDPKHAPKTWEEKLVNYADKRVKHHQVVTLKERFDDLEERYPDLLESSQWQIKRSLAFELEREIFERFDCNPLDIKSEALMDFDSLVREYS